jgi:hypothetical protein
MSLLASTLQMFEQIQCRRLSHEWGMEKEKTEASLSRVWRWEKPRQAFHPHKIYGETALNP